MPLILKGGGPIKRLQGVWWSGGVGVGGGEEWMRNSQSADCEEDNNWIIMVIYSTIGIESVYSIVGSFILIILA